MLLPVRVSQTVRFLNESRKSRPIFPSRRHPLSLSLSRQIIFTSTPWLNVGAGIIGSWLVTNHTLTYTVINQRIRHSTFGGRHVTIDKQWIAGYRSPFISAPGSECKFFLFFYRTTGELRASFMYEHLRDTRINETLDKHPAFFSYESNPFTLDWEFSSSLVYLYVDWKVIWRVFLWCLF